MADSQAVLLLKKQLKELSRRPVDGFSAGLVDDSNIFEWQTPCMRAASSTLSSLSQKTIPTHLPLAGSPRKCGTRMFIMMGAPGDDPSGYEKASERWSPVHTVETIMISIISMLSSPNDESPANVDAAKEWREDKDGFKKKISRILQPLQLLKLNSVPTAPTAPTAEAQQCTTRSNCSNS
eukprot:gene21851-28880_t